MISCLSTAPRTRGNTCRKKNVAAEEEIRKLRDEVNQKEERILCLSDKVERDKMLDAEMAAEFQGLQAGGEKKR